MTRFPLQVVQTIRRFALVAPGDRVLVALSGGPDSTALLAVLPDVLPRFDATLAGVAHVHHGLRGGHADADLDWCAQAAAARGLPFRGIRVDVPGESARRRWSIERTAHVLRHAALRKAAADLGATTIALGHTRDDQAETVILRFLRGAGTRGLAGMRPRRGRLVRPLLECSREAVEQYLVSRGLTYRDDASNADLRIPRNRVRHDLLPALIGMAGPGLPARLARQADQWREEDEWLEHSASPWIDRAVEPTPEGWVLHLDRLDGAPGALRRRVYWALTRRLLDERSSSRAVDLLARLATAREGQAVRLGGWRVMREGVAVRCVPTDGSHRSDTGAPGADVPSGLGFAVPLPVPGEATLPASGVRVTADVALKGSVGLAPQALGPDAAMVDADELGGPLVIRFWCAGDRVRPIGLRGSQKLQDVFVNRKVPRARRSQVPIVSTPDGRIVWVVGLAVDARVAVKATTSRVVILKATHPGGKA